MGVGERGSPRGGLWELEDVVLLMVSSLSPGQAPWTKDQGSAVHFPLGEGFLEEEANQLSESKH